MIKKVELNNWPSIIGRYSVGNKQSPIAICTMASIDLDFPKEKVAAYGKCVTENLGIEKIIQNIISNPNIRFLILCGQESKGHYVGQAFKCIVENGVEDNGKIIGAIGAMPYVKNLSKEQIEHFRKQVEVVDLIGSEDMPKIEKTIDECISRDPGAFEESRLIKREVRTINAEYDTQKTWTADERPDDYWFTILLDNNKKEIVVECYKGYGPQQKLETVIIGKTAEEIAGTIAGMKIVKGIYHAMYLGRELKKAEVALKLGLNYEQEKDLNFDKRL